MFPILLATAEAATGNLWQVVTAMSALAALGVSAITFIRMAGGKASERQIEPTQLAAMQAELKTQTAMLGNINRESGEAKAAIESVSKRLDEVRGDQRRDIEGVHQRIGGISRELAATTAKVEIALKRGGES